MYNKLKSNTEVIIELTTKLLSDVWTRVKVCLMAWEKKKSCIPVSDQMQKNPSKPFFFYRAVLRSVVRERAYSKHIHSLPCSNNLENRGVWIELTSASAHTVIVILALLRGTGPGELHKRKRRRKRRRWVRWTE